MTDHASFIRAIIAQPDRDLRRLEYADWLDEHDSRCSYDACKVHPNRYAERAEFIRAQIEIAQLADDRTRDDCQCPRCIKIAALRRRERELWNDGCLSWAEEVAGPLNHVGSINAVDCQAAVPFGEDGDDWIVCRWRRGFVEHVTCTAADWLRHGDAICAATPIREVTVTPTPEAGWYGNAKLMLRDRWPQVEKWNLPEPATAEPVVALNH